MKIRYGTFKKIVAEASQITASAGYMKKEKIRERLQQMIIDAVNAGDVTDKQSLDELVSSIGLATNTLKMIPIEVWQRLADTPGAAKKQRK